MSKTQAKIKKTIIKKKPTVEKQVIDKVAKYSKLKIARLKKKEKQMKLDEKWRQEKEIQRNKKQN